MLLMLISLDAATEMAMRSGCHMIVNYLSRFRNYAEFAGARSKPNDTLVAVVRAGKMG